jgi:hypothetical protein
MKREEFDDFFAGYLEAALFADLEEEHMGDFDADDIPNDVKAPERMQCMQFLKQAYKLIEDDDPVPGSHDDTRWNHAGRDFWFTRVGHGVGFWDGDWPKHGDALTRIAKKFTREGILEVEEVNGKQVVVFY